MRNKGALLIPKAVFARAVGYRKEYAVRAERNTYEDLKNEQIRLVSKKHVEGINRKEQDQLERITDQLSAAKYSEKLVEFDYFY